MNPCGKGKIFVVDSVVNATGLAKFRIGDYLVLTGCCRIGINRQAADEYRGGDGLF